MIKRSFFACTVLASMCFGAAGNAAVIDFDLFSNGEILSSGEIAGVTGGAGTYNFDGLDVSFSGKIKGGAAGHIAVFDTRDPSNTEDPDLLGDFELDAYPEGPINAGKVLIVQDNTTYDSTIDGFFDRPDDEVDGVFEVLFGQSVRLTSIDVLDIGPSELQLLSGPSLDVLVTLSIAGVGGSGAGEDDNKSGTFFLDDSDANTLIDGFRFTLGNSGAIDNFVVTPVPLPAALPLLTGAFASLGFLSWRRRRKAAATN